MSTIEDDYQKEIDSLEASFARAATANATIEWESPEGKRWVDKIANGKAFIKTEGHPFAQILPEAEITAEIRRDIANLTSRKKAQAHVTSERESQERELIAKKGLHGFTAGMPNVKARKIEETLDKHQGFSGEIQRRRDFIEKAVASGALVVKMRGGRVFELPSGSFYTEKDITKIGIDYAEFLLSLAAR